MKEIEIATEIAIGAGKILHKNFGSQLEPHVKPDGSLVSQADLDAEKFIIDKLLHHFPNDCIYSEEAGKIKGNNQDSWWIIDPLDGSHNFLNTISEYGVCIALEKEKKVIAGVIYLPEFDITIWANKGEGAFCNNKRIHVSKRPMQKALFNYEAKIKTEQQWQALQRIYTFFQTHLRMFYSTAYVVALLAQGKLDACYSADDQYYDFATAIIIVAEAGGAISNAQGEPPGHCNSFLDGFIASNNKFHNRLVKMINKTD